MTRRLASAAAALSAVVTLSACGTMSPVQTDQPYMPGDGVDLSLGDLDVRGLVIVADAKGGPGAFAGQLLNRGAEDLDVRFATKNGQQAVVKAPAHTSLTLGSATTTVGLGSVDAEPGGLIEVTVGSPTTGEAPKQVPVLPRTGYYATITAPPAPSASPTATPAG